MADDGGNGSEPGFPAFRHNQWTVEGEIERFGAFARGARSGGGAKRWIAVALVALMLASIAVNALSGLLF